MSLEGNTEPTLARNILERAMSAREWPPVTRNYLDHGGTIEAVGSALFKKAMDQSRWAGDGHYLMGVWG